MELDIKKYDEVCKEAWDNFVMKESMNGTFLQTRRFLDYHPKDKFDDVSILIYEKNKIVAVCPACCKREGERKLFISHSGSTYGGLVIHEKYYKAEKVLKIIDCFDNYVAHEGYKEIRLKITPDIFSRFNSSLFQYCLYNRGYRAFHELNTYIELENLKDNIIENFDRNKKRNILKCQKYSLSFRELFLDEEVKDFYRLLTINLRKYKLKPIHTLKEILDFKNNRLVKEVKFLGIYKEDVQMAGGMLFCFEQTNTIHAQNLSADFRFTEYSPITYLYYKVIEYAKGKGYSRLTWGISTENEGRKLNLSLVQNKESYGSEYALNHTFFKMIV